MPWIVLGLVAIGVALLVSAKHDLDEIEEKIDDTIPRPRPKEPKAKEPKTPKQPKNGTPDLSGRRFNEVNIESGRLVIKQGEVGIAQVELNFLEDLVVTEAALRKGIEDKGLLVLSIREERPDFWPANDEGVDYYIVATNDAATREFQIPSQLTRLWRVSAA